jgi:hypothetical protein
MVKVPVRFTRAFHSTMVLPASLIFGLEGSYRPGNPEEPRIFEALGSRFGTSFGMQGSEASGVISQADVNANLAGFDFYSRLYFDYLLGLRNPTRFRFPANMLSWNESGRGGTPNTYTNGTFVDDTNRP